MRLNAQSPLVWRQINSVIKERLGTQSNVYLYRGMHQAIFETLLGLQMRFSHKRKLVVQSGFGDHLSQAEIEMAKLGVRFKEELDEDLAKEEKSCLAYVHDFDDALTGEIYDHIESLKKVSSTKIHRIHLAHHLFHVKKSFVKSLTEFDIIIASLSRDYALVFTGEKVVLPTLIVSQLPWSIEGDCLPVVQMIEKQENLFQPEIMQFEMALPEGVRRWFTAQPARRIYDRSVVILDGHDGEAMMSLLNEALGFQDAGLGMANKIEAPSLCRWQNETWFQQAEKMGRTVEELQGTVIIDGSIINTAFSQVFKSCLGKLRELSS